MYYWKIWRDTRSRLFTFLILGLCFEGLVVWSQASWDLWGSGAAFFRPIPPAVATRTWLHCTLGAMVSGGIMIYILGLILGCNGLGEEIEQGTATFLLTRPRSRGYFVWSFWLASGLELLACTAIMMLAGYAALVFMIRSNGPWIYWLLAPVLMITGLLAVGFAQFLATAGRSSKYALAGGLVFSICYAIGVAALKADRIINLPSPIGLYSVSFSSALAGAMLGWLATALAFVVLTHLILRRMEV